MQFSWRLPDLNSTNTLSRRSSRLERNSSEKLPEIETAARPSIVHRASPFERQASDQWRVLAFAPRFRIGRGSDSRIRSYLEKQATPSGSNVMFNAFTVAKKSSFVWARAPAIHQKLTARALPCRPAATAVCECVCVHEVAEISRHRYICICIYGDGFEISGI